MCQPVKNYLALIREYTREVVMFGGAIAAVFLYMDVRQLVADGNANNVRTAEILRTIEARIQHLEECHERESQWRAAQGTKYTP